MYGFLAQEQTCPPEAPLVEGECVCLDVNTHWDLSRKQCVANAPSALTQRPTGSKTGGGTWLFVGLLLAAGVAAYVLAQNPEFAERLVTP